MSPLFLLPVLVLSATHARWAAAVRTEVRARNAGGQDLGTAAAGDAELRPSLSGALSSGQWTFGGSYSPALRAREPYLHPVADHSHLLQLEGVWVREALARAFLGEVFNYGTLDLSTINRPGATGAVPSPQPLRLGVGLTKELTTETSAGVDWYLSRNLTLTTTAGFLYGGGADEASRVNLRLQSTVKGGARASWLASSRDKVGVNLAAQYVRFYEAPATATAPAYGGARIVIPELSGSYTRQLGPNTSADGTIGVTGAFGQLPDPVRGAPAYLSTNAVAPLLAAALSHRVPMRGQRLDLRLGGQLAPFVDRFAGTAYQRVEANGSAGWTHVKDLSGALQLGASRTLPGADAVSTTVYGEATAGYAGARWWRADLVGRLSLVQGSPPLPPPPDPPFPLDVQPAPPLEKQWVIGLSVTFLAASEQPREQPREQLDEEPGEQRRTVSQ